MDVTSKKYKLFFSTCSYTNMYLPVRKYNWQALAASVVKMRKISSTLDEQSGNYMRNHLLRRDPIHRLDKAGKTTRRIKCTLTMNNKFKYRSSRKTFENHEVYVKKRAGIIRGGTKV